MCSCLISKGGTFHLQSQPTVKVHLWDSFKNSRPVFFPNSFSSLQTPGCPECNSREFRVCLHYSIFFQETEEKTFKPWQQSMHVGITSHRYCTFRVRAFSAATQKWLFVTVEESFSVSLRTRLLSDLLEPVVQVYGLNCLAQRKEGHATIFRI